MGKEHAPRQQLVAPVIDAVLSAALRSPEQHKKGMAMRQVRRLRVFEIMQADDLQGNIVQHFLKWHRMLYTCHVLVNMIDLLFQKSATGF